MNQPSSGIATAVAVTLPEWVPGVVDGFPACTNDIGRMRLAITLARENVERGSGDPSARRSSRVAHRGRSRSA